MEKENAPNKYLQPFAHQQWKIMNRIVGQEEIGYTSKHRVRGISQFVYRFSKSFLGILGIIILVMLVLGAVIIPFTSQDPNATSSLHHEQMFGDNNILGTDGLGRDLWARLWYGLRFSFELAFMATLIDVFIGVVLGILMGQYKKFDMVMQWIIKVLSNIPTIIIMILMTLLFHPSFWILVLSLSLT
ncbi:MAG: ABC transporter permease, partial [Mycoplasmataceae bacterium]|nr:ABC transporter permease [Mycoplasmataceae bacterium]